MNGKVLWGEGLLLRPQHFQRQDQYHEHRLHKSIAAVHPYAWGMERLEIDPGAPSAATRCGPRSGAGARTAGGGGLRLH